MAHGRPVFLCNGWLNLIRGLRGISTHAHVLSENSFPAGAGIASSASAFAALTLAIVNACGLELSERDLTRLARRGSGSASRSIPTGFVEWYKGNSDVDSFAVSIAKPDYWKLSDCIAIVETDHKKIGSTDGHKLASTSPLQQARVIDSDRRLDICRDAIAHKDFSALAEVIEQDSNLMHAVMLTSRPALIYWQPVTLEIMKTVMSWRKSGIPAAFTIDAGPNVHIVCETQAEETIKHRLRTLPGVREIIVAHPGGPTKLV
jgi:diphosphomevalonate decarboxylase